MKKLLLATSILAGTAGFAFAEVTVSGNGRMGVVYNGDDLNFTSRVRAEIAMSSETDGGLKFGGSFGVHDAGAATNGSSGSIYIEGSFGKLTMGDVDGAAEVAVGNLPMASLTGLGDGNDVVYLSDIGKPGGFLVDNPRALYTYTAGSLTFAASFNDGKVGGGSVDSVNIWALGVKYALGDYTFGLGYESFEPVVGASVDHIVASANATFGTTTVTLVYGTASDIDFDQLGLGVASTFDAVTVKAYVNRRENGPAGDTTAYGIGAEYDLGGGAKLVGGVADLDNGVGTIADFGLSFSF